MNKEGGGKENGWEEKEREEKKKSVNHFRPFFLFDFFLPSIFSFQFLSLSTLENFKSTMSWQAYVDTNLVGTKKITKAAIHGHDGSLWATSKGFAVSNPLDKYLTFLLLFSLSFSYPSQLSSLLLWVPFSRRWKNKNLPHSLRWFLSTPSSFPASG